METAIKMAAIKRVMVRRMALWRKMSLCSSTSSSRMVLPIEHRQRERQEDDGAEGAQPVLLGAAQQQIELFQPVPDEGADDEKQGQTQDDVDGPEPGMARRRSLSPSARRSAGAG
jgi:hypothetical protein